AQFKNTFQHPLTRSLGGMLMTHYLFPNKEGKSVAIVYQNATIGAFVRDFFIGFTYTATIALRKSALRKR
ncbi:hypothetical protein ACKKDI_004130, partial [Shigella flexneri]